MAKTSAGYVSLEAHTLKLLTDSLDDGLAPAGRQFIAIYLINLLIGCGSIFNHLSVDG